MSYIKEDGKIYEIATTKRLINLDNLKAELEMKKAIPEPTDKELIEMGKMFHPYYLNDTKDLEAKIKELEKVK